jgi:hypothetical protein
MLSKAVVGLLERTAFSAELSPALFEGTLLEGTTCGVYLAAFQLGYSLGSPLGTALAKGIGTELKTAVKTAVEVVLSKADSNWVSTAASGQNVIVSGEDPTLGQYWVTAFTVTDDQGHQTVMVQGVVHSGFIKSGVFGSQSTFLLPATSIESSSP